MAGINGCEGKDSCRAYPMRGKRACIFHRHLVREEKDIERLLEENKTMRAKLEAANLQDSVDIARGAQELDPEEQFKAEQKIEKVKEEIETRKGLKNAAFMAHLMEQMRVGETMMIYVTEEEHGNWSGRYMLNGVKWPLAIGPNPNVPRDIGEVIESQREMIKDSKIIEAAIQISEPSPMQLATASQQEAINLKNTGNMLELSVLNALIAGNKGNPDLARKILKGRGG